MTQRHVLDFFWKRDKELELNVLTEVNEIGIIHTVAQIKSLELFYAAFPMESVPTPIHIRHDVNAGS